MKGLFDINPYEVLFNKLSAIEERISLIQLRQLATDQDEEKLLSPAEACQVFEPKVSKQTLQNWADQGLIQKHTLGRKVFYKKSEILAGLQTLKKYRASRPIMQPPLTSAS